MRKSEIVSISLKGKQIIEKLACTSYPDEFCGILFGTELESGHVKVSECCPADNVSPRDKGKHFLIDPIGLYRYELSYSKKGEEIIGFAHSHPDAMAVLSVEDQEKMIPGQLYMILEIRDGNCKDCRIYRKKLFDETITEVSMQFI